MEPTYEWRHRASTTRRSRPTPSSSAPEPVGLFQCSSSGCSRSKAHIIDSLPYAGGRCIELYPDKPIYDIPAVPVCTGKELTDNLLKQIEPFGATFHLGQEVTGLQKQGDGRFLVTTGKGTRLLTKTVFIAGGVGSFQPRTLKLDGLDKYLDTQLFYRVRNPAQFAGKNLVIVGGGDSALDWALNFVQEGPHQAGSVILVHRRDGFRAAPASVAKMRELCDELQMQFLVGQVTGFEEDDGRLAAIKVTGGDAVTRSVPLDMLLVFFGLSPKLGPIAEWGLGIEQIVVDTGVREQHPRHLRRGRHQHLPGKKKLIRPASTGGAGRLGARHIFQAHPLQYTTTSPKLHKVLGGTPVFD